MKKSSAFRKPITKILNSKSHAALEANAQKGLCAISLVASASEIPAVVAESLPEDKYCFLKDFSIAIDKISEALMGLRPQEGKAFVMIDRRSAMDLILTLVLAETKTGGLLDGPSNAEVEIRASHKELVKTANQVNEILTLASTTEMSIEEFRTRVDSLNNPPLAKQLLEVMSMKAPRVRSSAGPVQLKLENKALKDLPSNRTHEIEVMVTRGFDDQANTVHVMAKTLIDADSKLFSSGEIFRILCLDADKRILLLLAQAAKKLVKVKVSIQRVPIFSAARVDLLATLEHITVLECEDDEQLKNMLLQQLQLEI